MRIRSITVRGFAPYLTQQRVDLDQLPGPLVAVTGPNGAGKSTLLELALAAFTRRPPTRGKLATLATERDATIEVTAHVGGRDLVFHHSVDGLAATPKAEAYVHGTGDARFDAGSGKLGTFDAWVAEHLPAEDVLLASVFAAQASTGFLGAKPAERKSILLRALGIDRLERMAERARERVRDIEKELATIDARIAETEPRATVDREELELANRKLDAERLDLVNAEAQLADVIERVRREREAAPLREKRRELRARIEALQTRRASGETWLETHRAALAALPTPPPALALTCAKAALDYASKLAGDAHAAWSAIAAQLAADQREAARLGKDAADAFTAVLAAEKKLEDAREAVKYDESDIEQMHERVDVMHALVKELEASLNAAREVRVAGAEERIAGLRGGLEAIRDFDMPMHGWRSDRADRTLRDDDTLAAAAEAAPEHVRALTTELADTRGKLHDLIQQLGAAERALAHLTTLTKTLDIDALQARETSLRADRDVAELRFQATKSADYRAKQEAERLIRTRDGIATELDALQQRAAAASQADVQRARIEEGEARLADIVAELNTLAAELDATPEPEPWVSCVPNPNQLEAEARRNVDLVRAAVTAAEHEVALCERAEKDAADAMARLKTLVSARREVEVRLTDAAKLALDLGRDGLQAMELDAAGPELSTLATDLLHRAFGARWTVSFETLRSSADGKREIETLEVRVLDTHTGYEGPVEALSGGERAIVGEAVSLALTVLACRGAGLEAPTLVRDESGAALDPEKSEAYVKMLRIAAELVGASRVLFVSHDPRAAELADSRIEIADGVITVGGAAGGARAVGGDVRVEDAVSAASEEAA